MITVKPEELREMLHMGRVIFSYKKKDGSTRGALGTLNMEHIPEEFHPKDSSENIEYKNLRYFDIQKNGWRSISGDINEITVL